MIGTNILLILICLLFVFLIFCVFYIKKIKKNSQITEDNIKLIINTINSVRYGNLAARLIINERNKFPVLSESINRMVETIQDREKMIQEFKNEITGHNLFLEKLINSLSDGFLILNEDFIIQKMTAESEKLLGKDAEGKALQIFLDFPQECDFSKRISFETDLKINTNIRLFIILSQLDFANNVNFKYLVTLKDISKECELNQIKNDFIATLAHDLRVPLLAECNTLNLLKNGTFGELNLKTSEVIDLLLQSNKDVLLLTDVLLETYKHEQTNLVLQKQTVNVNNLIKEVCDEMFGFAEANKMKIILNLCEDFDFELDILQIKRVLRNLINNSLDYSAQMSDKIDIFSKKDDKGCYITIRDYGAGITKDEQEHLFQKFYSGAHRFRKVGSGLGLYLANEIVKAHNGKISIYSVPDEKTEFVVFLPL